MTAKQYTCADLRALMKDESGDTGTLYSFEPSGLWLRVSKRGWDLLTQQERENLAGCFHPEVKRDYSSVDQVLVGLPNQRPLLPFPFTANQLLQFNAATGSIRECLPLSAGHAQALAHELSRAVGPGAEVNHNVAELILTLLDTTAPEAETSASQLNASRPTDDQLREQIQQLARDYIAAEVRADRHPSQEAVGDYVSRTLRELRIMGKSGAPLAGSYIKRHFLKGISAARYRRRSTAPSQGK